MEGACGSVGDHWKGLRIGKNSKIFLELEGGQSLKNAEGV